MKKLQPSIRRARAGFTLIEVLFTVVILAVLAAVAVPMYASTKTESEKSTCLTNIRALQSAETKLAFDTGVFAATADAANLIGKGLAEVPSCPADATAYTMTLNAAGDVTIKCGGDHTAMATHTVTLKKP